MMCEYRDIMQHSLTQREVEVLRLVALGFESEQIGRKLGIGLQTVASHRKSISSKTGCRNAVEKCLWAIRAGLIEPSEQVHDAQTGRKKMSRQVGQEAAGP